MLTYEIERILPYPIGRLFEIAADVESYPRYFPNWKAARVVRRHNDGYETEQVLSYGPIRERFRSVTRVDPPDRIAVDSSSRTFRQFRVIWRFDDLDRRPPSTRVRLEGHLEFRSTTLEKVMRVVISDSLRPFIDAFEREVCARTAGDPDHPNQVIMSPSSPAPAKNNRPGQNGPASRG